MSRFKDPLIITLALLVLLAPSVGPFGVKAASPNDSSPLLQLDEEQIVGDRDQSVKPSSRATIVDGPATKSTGDVASVQENLQLVGEIGGNINDVTLWTHYAFLGQGQRLVMLDMADTSDPAFVWQSVPLLKEVSSIAIAGDRVYVTAGDSLMIFTIQIGLTPPVQLNGVYELTAIYYPAEAWPHATDVAVQGDYAYVTFGEGNWMGGGNGFLAVIDVSNPDAPAEAGRYPAVNPEDFATSVAVDGDYAYVCFRSGFTVVDISNPSAPFKRGSSEEVLGGWDVALSGDYALVGTSFDSPAFRVIDISNPDAPSQVGSHSNRGLGSAYGVAVDAPYVYVTDTSGGLHILSIASPSSPTEVGTYDLSDDPDGDHLAAWHVAVAGGTAYVVIDENGLHVLDVSDKADPSKLGSYEAYVADPTGVDVAGRYAYVTDEKRGLVILDMANPAVPKVVGVWENDDPSGWPVDVSVVGDYAYVLSDDDLIAIDVSNPTTPFEAGRYGGPSGGGTYLTAAGDTAYVIASGKGLFAYDLSNPAAPAMVSTEAYDFDASTWGLGRPVVRGSHLYLPCSGKLCHANVSDPANPVAQPKHETAGYVSGVDVARLGDHLHLAELSDTRVPYLSGLRILLSTAAYPQVGYVPVDTSCSNPYCWLYVGVSDDDDEAYLVGDEPVVRVVDVRTASAPAVAGSHDMPVGTDQVVVEDGHAYVPLPRNGLMVFRHIPRTSRSIAPAGGTLTSTVDNTSYTFPSGTFTQAVTVTHTPLTDNETPAAGSLLGIGHAYQVSAIEDVTKESVEPSGSYTVTIGYTDAEVGAAIENTLGLYVWDGAAWVPEPTSEVDPAENSVTGAPDHFSIWAVLGETRRVFLPLVLRQG